MFFKGSRYEKVPEATHVDQFAVGAKQTMRITLVTADYNLLACAAEQSFDGVHCAYKSVTDVWPRDPKETHEDHNNKLNIIDGPFAESKEMIGGFAILELDSMEEAIELSRPYADILGGG